MNHHKQQHASTPGKEIVLPLVISDLEQRARDGYKKYGTMLHTHNGRNPLIDAYQEALDLCMYLKQALLESQPVDDDEITTDAFKWCSICKTPLQPPGPDGNCLPAVCRHIDESKVYICKQCIDQARISLHCFVNDAKDHFR